MKKKLVFISNMAAPYQVKFCYELNEYFEAEFWFYKYLENNRPKWWKIPLGEKCKILRNVKFSNSKRYFTLDVLKELKRFNPDIVMLGGVGIPSNLIAYLWAILKRKKIIFITELYRGREKNNKVQRIKKFGLYASVIRIVFFRVDKIFTVNIDAYKQFTNEFKFKTKQVELVQYPSDIDQHLNHTLRSNSDITLLFANRLTENYNPLFALKVFKKVLEKCDYQNVSIQLNCDGPLYEKCREFIKNNNIEDKATFLNSIDSWDNLHLVYKNADILLLPAKFSNGNFTIVEAMASGMGVIISNQVFGVGRMIENGINGFVLEKDDDLEECVNYVMNYIQSKNLYYEHMEINREKVKNLSIKATAELYYRKISNNIFL